MAKSGSAVTFRTFRSESAIEDNCVKLAKVTTPASGAVTIETYPTQNQYIVFETETEPTGFDRKEAMMELSSVSEKMKEEVKNNLAKATETINAEITNFSDYKMLWDLGDFINIKVHAFGNAITFLKQITEVEEIYEANNKKIIPTFGVKNDNIIRKLLKGRD